MMRARLGMPVPEPKTTWMADEAATPSARPPITADNVP